jgi:hypothetical protein
MPSSDELDALRASVTRAAGEVRTLKAAGAAPEVLRAALASLAALRAALEAAGKRRRRRRAPLEAPISAAAAAVAALCGRPTHRCHFSPCSSRLSLPPYEAPDDGAQASKWPVDKRALDDCVLRRMFVVPAFEIHGCVGGCVGPHASSAVRVRAALASLAPVLYLFVVFPSAAQALRLRPAGLRAARKRHRGVEEPLFARRRHPAGARASRGTQQFAAVQGGGRRPPRARQACSPLAHQRRPLTPLPRLLLRAARRSSARR